MQKTLTLRLSDRELNVLKKESAAQRLSMNAFIMRVLDQSVPHFAGNSKSSAVKPTHNESIDLSDIDFED